jgi:hypothetical protein
MIVKFPTRVGGPISAALWAIADLPVAAKIERAHQAAVAAALRFVEAPFTREGTAGYARNGRFWAFSHRRR